MKKIIVGLVEDVKVIGKKTIASTAKVDTGAARSCVDEKIAIEAGLGPIIKFVRVKSATTGRAPFVRRPVFRAKIEVGGKKIPVEVSVANRGNLKHKVLIGRDIIRSNFVVDVERSKKTK